MAVCIDHRELFRLGQMMDELFGEANRIGIINWQKAFSPKNDSKHLSTGTEYVLVYARTLEKARTGLLPRDEKSDQFFIHPDEDPDGKWAGKDPTAREYRKNSDFGIQSPFTGMLHYPEFEHQFQSIPPAPVMHWRGMSKSEIKLCLEEWGTKYIERDLGDGRGKALVITGSKIALTDYDPSNDSVVKAASKKAYKRLEQPNWPKFYFRDNRAGIQGAGRPRLKNHFQNVKRGKVALTYWADEEYDTPLQIDSQSWDHGDSGHSKAGIDELDVILGKGHGFETVKPLKLIEKIIQLWCPPSGLILDPFAGSGTTGHAVWRLNGETGSNRRFVLIEQGRPERGDSYARTLTAERLRRVVDGSWANGKGVAIPGGFTFNTLTKKVDAPALLKMERDEMVETVIYSYFDSAKRGRPNLIRIENNFKHLVAKNIDNEGIFLVWDGPNKNTDLTRDVYSSVAAEAKAAGLTNIFHIYARLQVYVSGNVRFYQIPDQILADFGLNPMSEPFAEVGE